MNICFAHLMWKMENSQNHVRLGSVESFDAEKLIWQKVIFA